MTFELTQQQQAALDRTREHPPRVVDPRSNVAYVLLAESEYESVRDILQDEARQKAISAVALRNASGRINEAIE